jgi:HPt (histidine-containing phosphotransfer) domain-containing protein
LLSEIIEIFIQRYPELMAEVQQAIAWRNAKELERAAQSLREYLVNLHALSASETALELKIKGRRNDCTDTEKIFSKLEKQVATLASALSAQLKCRAIPL